MDISQNNLDIPISSPRINYGKILHECFNHPLESPTALSVGYKYSADHYTGPTTRKDSISISQPGNAVTLALTMMMFRIFGVAAATLLLAVSAEQATIAPVTAAPSSLLNTRGSVPKLPADEKTTKNCVWWIENDGSKPCLDIPGYWGISFVDWFVWVCLHSSLYNS